MSTFTDHVRCSEVIPEFVLAPTVGLNPDQTNGIDALIITAVANAASADTVTITNASFGQASVLTIPDPGVSAASFVLAPSGSSSVLTSTVTMSATTIATAYATPVQLVPAPGAGLAVLVTNAYVSVNSTGNTALATGTAPIIQYGNTVHGAGTIATATGLVAGDITASTSQTRNLFPIATGAQTGLSNKGIFFSNATGAYTAGAGTTVSITVAYVIVASNN